MKKLIVIFLCLGLLCTGSRGFLKGTSTLLDHNEQNQLVLNPAAYVSGLIDYKDETRDLISEQLPPLGSDMLKNVLNVLIFPVNGIAFIASVLESGLNGVERLLGWKQVNNWVHDILRAAEKIHLDYIGGD